MMPHFIWHTAIGTHCFWHYSILQYSNVTGRVTVKQHQTYNIIQASGITLILNHIYKHIGGSFYLFICKCGFLLLVFISGNHLYCWLQSIQDQTTKLLLCIAVNTDSTWASFNVPKYDTSSFYILKATWNNILHNFNTFISWCWTPEITLEYFLPTPCLFHMK